MDDIENKSETVVEAVETPEDDLKGCKVNTTLDGALFVGRIAVLFFIAIIIASAIVR